MGQNVQSHAPEFIDGEMFSGFSPLLGAFSIICGPNLYVVAIEEAVHDLFVQFVHH